LSYFYVGHGLVGEDVRALEALTDDVKQIDLYRQFIPPTATGIYPFMILGSISPIIFTTAPAFINMFSGPEQFLIHNKEWIDNITAARSKPTVTTEALTKSVRVARPKAEATDVKPYTVGKRGNIPATPQTGPADIPAPTPQSLESVQYHHVKC